MKMVLSRCYTIALIWVFFKCGSRENNVESSIVIEDRSQDFTTKDLPETQKIPSTNVVQYLRSFTDEGDESHDIRKKDHIEIERFDDDDSDEFIDERSETEDEQPVAEIDDDDIDDDDQMNGKVSSETSGSGETMTDNMKQDKPVFILPEQDNTSIKQQKGKNDSEFEISNSDEENEEQGSGSAEQPGSGNPEQEQKYVKDSFNAQSTTISEESVVKDVNLSNETNSTFRAEDYGSANKSLSVYNETINRNETQYSANEKSVGRQVFQKEKTPAEMSHELKETNSKIPKNDTAAKTNPIPAFSKENVNGSLVVRLVNESSTGKKMQAGKHETENRTSEEKILGAINGSLEGKVSELAKETTQPVKLSTTTLKQRTQNHVKTVEKDKKIQLNNGNDSLHQAVVKTQKKKDNHKTEEALNNPNVSKETTPQTHKPFSGLHPENKTLRTQNNANKKVKTEKKTKFVKLQKQKQKQEQRLFKNVRPKPVSKVKHLLTQTAMAKKPAKMAHGPVVTTKAEQLSKDIAKAKTTEQHHECHLDAIKKGYSLRGGTSAGHFEMLGRVSDMSHCINHCCKRSACDVALLLEDRCFGVACYSTELCQPIPVPHPDYVITRLAYIGKHYKRNEVMNNELKCVYGNRTLDHNEKWSGKLCGAVVTCQNGVVMVTKCPGMPPRPRSCAQSQLVVQKRNGECCKMHWKCTGSSCKYGALSIKHGYSFSDELCTGVVSCNNGHLTMKYCPMIPEKPPNCANPQLKIIKIPGNCCKKYWDCTDKSCIYNNHKMKHGEKLTDGTCSNVVKCNHGYLSTNTCPGPPRVPRGCINPTLKVKRNRGKCCTMQWACAVR